MSAEVLHLYINEEIIGQNLVQHDASV